jgi:membrane fusion protein, heavy metal efflux system
MRETHATLRRLAPVLVVALLLGCRGRSAEEAPGPAAHTEGEGHGHEKPRFRVEDFERSGVQVVVAAAGTVDVGFDLPGEVRPDGDRLAHLAPRFPGIVREVRKRAGDTVRAGEVLAVVESETLALFELKAAFDGIVVDRHVAPGEAVDRERPAFIVADLSTVWVDIHVYQSALPELRLGQPVRIAAAAGPAAAEGHVSYIAPVVDQATRTAGARVVLPNPEGTWRPGLFVTVTVLNPVEAPVVVARKAIHTFEDASVVFVVDGDHFEPRRVVLGRKGRAKVEIAAGLSPGDRFAEEGSFLVKAELGKSAAGHEH